MIGNYTKVIASRKQGIEKKRAYLVGGGIASLAAAAYLIRDGHMAGDKITILEQLDINGGCLDGSGNATDGYIMRGGREMEAHYECTWDLYSFIPDLMTKVNDDGTTELVPDPSNTVLKTIRDVNQWDPNSSKCRLMSNCGEPDRDPSLGLSLKHVLELTKLTLKTEEELGATTVKEFFSNSYFETPMWFFWTSMFAMETWHSVVEMRRYMQRFMHLLPTMSKLENILFTTYNQYESMVLPLQTWLKSKGVNFDLNTQVTDLDMKIENNEKTVTAIHLLRTSDSSTEAKEEVINTTEDDLVFVTNGSMTENSTTGNNNTPAILNTEVGACWSLWKKIAAKDPAFGKPDVFCTNIDKSKFVSFTITATDSPIAGLLKKFTGVDPYSHKAVTGGIMTIKDSSWLMSVTCNRQPQYRSQPVGDHQPKEYDGQPDKNVLAIWAYGLFPDNVGDYVKKKMCDCTGEELLTELLYHWGAEDQIPEILKTTKVIPCMMPYITSQFLPRVKGDRPEVVPEGSKNFAFLGQFTEIPEDCVFTVEYSVRSAIMAVYTLLGITDKKPPEVFPSKDDIRVILRASETLHGGSIPGEHLLSHLLKGTSLHGLLDKG